MIKVAQAAQREGAKMYDREGEQRPREPFSWEDFVKRCTGWIPALNKDQKVIVTLCVIGVEVVLGGLVFSLL